MSAGKKKGGRDVPPAARQSAAEVNKTAAEKQYTDGCSATSNDSITVLGSKTTPLNKTIRLVDGAIEKKANGALYDGWAETAPFTGAAGLLALLESLKPNQATALGRLMAPNGSRVKTAATYDPAAGEIARSQRFFKHRPEPGWALFDFDLGSFPGDVLERVDALGGPWPALLHIHPEAAGCAHVVRPSASDGLHAQGIPMSNSPGGVHIYVRIDDMTKTKELLDLVMDRSWAAGLGFIKLSKNGRPLVRGLIDAAVHGPERLIYEAAPTLIAPVQRRVEPGVAVEGRTLSAPLRREANAPAAQRAIEAEKARMAPEIARVKNEAIKRRAKVHREATGCSRREAERQAGRFVEGGILFDHDVLLDSDGATWTVAQVLDGAWRHNQSVPCPDAGIEYGNDNATFMRNPRPGKEATDRPVINSFAHGGAIFRFDRYEQKVPATEIMVPARCPVKPGTADAARLHVETSLDLLRGDVMRWSAARARLKKEHAADFARKHAPERLAKRAARAAEHARRAQDRLKAAQAAFDAAEPGERRRMRRDLGAARRACAESLAKAAKAAAAQESLTAEDLMSAAYLEQTGLPSRPPEPSDPPPVHAMRVSTGVGKTTLMMRAARQLVDDLRAADDMRSVIIAVPTQALATQIEAKLRAAGANALAYRGRAQPDPEGGPDETMCKRPVDAEEVAKALLNVQKTLCARPKQKRFCSFHANCAYQRQLKNTPDIWIIQHVMLWQPAPPMIKVAALVVDEDPSAGALSGFDRPVRHNLAQLGAPIPGLEEADPQAAASLLSVTKPLAAALDLVRGRVLLPPLEAALKAARISLEDLATVADVAWYAKLDGLEDQNLTGQDLIKALKPIAATNAIISRTARLLNVIADAGAKKSRHLAGVSVEDVKGKDPHPDWTAIRLHWRMSPYASWRVPTVVMSATLQDPIIRSIWPQLNGVVSAEAGMPSAIVRQITDSANPKGSLLSKALTEDDLGEDGLTARSRISRLVRYAVSRQAQLGGRWLIIAQMDVIGALKKHDLPDQFETAHFNALAGLDQWKDVRGVIIIGRPLPSPDVVELMAEVRTGEPIQRLREISDGKGRMRLPWYPLREGGLNLRGSGAGPAVYAQSGAGGSVRLGFTHHPDRAVEAERWRICEGELIQAVGRARGVNRTAQDPVAIDILCHIPLPLSVDEAGPFRTFEPTAGEWLAAVHGLAVAPGAQGCWPVAAGVLGADWIASAASARQNMSPKDLLPGAMSGQVRSWQTGTLELTGGKGKRGARVRLRDTAALDAIRRRFPAAIYKPSPKPRRRIGKDETPDAPVEDDRL